MKKENISSILFYVASTLFYVAAIINLAGGNRNSMAVVWMCLGSAFLCLGSLHKKKDKESRDDSKKE